MGVEMADVRIEPVGSADNPTLAKLVELGDLARRTLGLLPPAVYHDAAAKNCLLAAFVGDEPIGYALFRLPRDEVVLTHLCVQPDYRRAGVAKLLVDELSKRHRQRQGVKAKCRDDYQAIADVWQGLGFAPRAKTHGRGHDRAPMTVWWRDHGHPNLFTPPMEEPTVVRVALDTNILLDLQPSTNHHRPPRSELLLAQHLSDRMELIVSYGLERDIGNHRVADPTTTIEFASTFTRPRGSRSRAEQLFDAMRTEVRAHDSKFPRSEQDIGDLWHLAEAAAAGAQVFLTWDERLCNDVAPHALKARAPELSRMRVLDPDHLEIRLDELANAAAYSPSDLAGSEFTTARVGSDARQHLQHFLDHNRGESKSEFRARLREAARTRDGYEVVRAPDSALIACYSLTIEDSILDVPLLRLTDHPIAETLTRQLLWGFRHRARQASACVVRLTDPYLSETTRRIAETESYRSHNSTLAALVVDRTGPGTMIGATATAIGQLIDLPPTLLIRPHETAATAAHYERLWWPAKITDSELPGFVVPIKPRWSTDLFGVPAALLARDSQLALGRQHVYFRSGRRSCLRAPSRILWYMSSSDSSGEGKFIGTSLLDHTERGTPQTLHDLYGRYGIFRIEDIEKAATNNIAEALLISDTELFDNPIHWSTYMALKPADDGPRSVQGPAKISSTLFERLYRYATGRHESRT
ncbi:GNAT family N-acetyltransferase [Nocardia sp. NPDC101769]|uniref:GNAT family N-acetyltransferase n=1 Tax=Nocardia sp. NPDC101769 TaxID=3364333 RepID=UPI003830D0A3